MMTLKLKDKTEVTLTDDQGVSAQNAVVDGAEFIRIAGELYSRKSIDTITQGGTLPEKYVDPWATEASQKLEEKKCQGVRSIQREINDIAKSLDRKTDDNNPQGLGWAKLITDKKWREKIRQQLLAQDPEGWCDYKAGKCVCYEA